MKDMNIKANEYTTKRDKVKLLKEMHAVMLSMNNELAYDEWTWTMPDMPMKEDFEDIASDADMFTECIDEFNNIFNTYKSDGLYDIEDEAIELLKRYHITIEVHF